MTEKKPLPPSIAARVAAAHAAAQDLEDSAMALAHDLKYPVDAHGSVLDMNQLNHLYPDVLPVQVYHLIRAGWRRVEEKRLIKSRPVVAAGFYEDLVTWVPMDSPDDPINIPAPADVSDLWSVKPIVTEEFEERK